MANTSYAAANLICFRLASFVVLHRARFRWAGRSLLALKMGCCHMLPPRWSKHRGSQKLRHDNPFLGTGISYQFGFWFRKFCLSLNDIDLHRSTCIKVASAGYVGYVVCLTTSETAKVVLIVALLVEASCVMSRWLRTPEPRFHSHDTYALRSQSQEPSSKSHQATKSRILSRKPCQAFLHQLYSTFQQETASKRWVRLAQCHQCSSGRLWRRHQRALRLCAKTFATLGLCIIVVTSVGPVKDQFDIGQTIMFPFSLWVFGWPQYIFKLKLTMTSMLVDSHSRKKRERETAHQ